jgi:hypothetical protein
MPVQFSDLLRRLLLAATLGLCVAPAALADSVSVSNLTVGLSPAGTSASIAAELTAHSGAGNQVSLDDLSVELFLDGTAVDLNGGPITLDISGFLSLPLSLGDGESVSAGPLFALNGLTAGSYTGDFFLIENIIGNDGELFLATPLESPPQDFAFTVRSATSVPEPGVIWLAASGFALCILPAHKRKRRF